MVIDISQHTPGIVVLKVEGVVCTNMKKLHQFVGGAGGIPHVMILIQVVRILLNIPSRRHY